jgi:hypothetical protein
VTTFRDKILSPLDAIRGIGGRLGLRRFTVTVRQRAWTGGIPGQGTSSDTTTVLQNIDATGTAQPVIVRQVSRSEAIASGGLYTERDVRVGPMTPTYAATFFQPSGGGYTDGQVNPGPVSGATQLQYLVAGPGWPSPHGLAELIGLEATDLHTYAILRSTGRQA